ncbi:MAG: 3-deoxy-D-manno-octulosonic-acid transferase [Gammaproteobacteria bacterium]|jgi:3-deoxy-D-manno-octulosonic-acid transferase
MYLIYLLVIYLLLPVVIIRLILVCIRNPEYRIRVMERFGVSKKPETKNKIIWIHAVSVGEVHATKPLVDYIHDHYFGYSIIITTVTPTGAFAVNKLFAGKVIHRYLPYDIPYFINKFLNTLQPTILLVMETEIWPALFTECKKNRIPIVLINARLSDKSLTGYRIFSKFTKLIISYITVIAAQSETDAKRFISLGARTDKTFITGNLKFDVTIPESVYEEGQSIKIKFEQRPIFLAASTHDGEEILLLKALLKIKVTIPECLLIIAPRHPDRTSKIRKLCEKEFLSTTSYSDNIREINSIDVFILDTLGQLTAYYAAADIAFVGGSLVPIGGHNILEPAILSLPIITGEYLSNFREISSLLLNEDALLIINEPDTLSEAVIKLFQDAKLRQKMGDRAKAVIDMNKGKTQKLMKLIGSMIS